MNFTFKTHFGLQHRSALLGLGLMLCASSAGAQTQAWSGAAIPASPSTVQRTFVTVDALGNRTVTTATTSASQAGVLIHPAVAASVATNAASVQAHLGAGGHFYHPGGYYHPGAYPPPAYYYPSPYPAYDPWAIRTGPLHPPHRSGAPSPWITSVPLGYTTSTPACVPVHCRTACTPLPAHRVPVPSHTFPIPGPPHWAHPGHASIQSSQTTGASLSISTGNAAISVQHARTRAR